jgi:hypothetical protein
VAVQIPVEKVVEKERVVERMVPVPGPERVVFKDAPRAAQITREPVVQRAPEPIYVERASEPRYVERAPQPRFVERASPPPQSPPSPPRSRTAVGVGLSLFRREHVSCRLPAPSHLTSIYGGASESFVRLRSHGLVICTITENLCARKSARAYCRVSPSAFLSEARGAVC